jgi:hypothetical protein
VRPRDPAALSRLIECLDWTGHVELPQADIEWLASELFAYLSPGDMRLCDSCGEVKEVVVATATGRLCEACLEEAYETAKAQRALLED